MYFFSCDEVVGARIQQAVTRSYHELRVLLMWITMAMLGSNGRFSTDDFQIFREYLRDLVATMHAVQAVGRSVTFPGDNIIAIEEAIVLGIRHASQDDILDAADLLRALLTADQRVSHYDQWFAVFMCPLIHPLGHRANPIVLSDNGRSFGGSSDSSYDSMPDLEYPLSPLYNPQSPEA
ncbi:hypothetical protein M413DRAFT_7791 [Hebeloma cylindrosporum]|uniref:Uncharacterized protein n=1 Tax=Hebeloma cylindrosporum TaxID=76867 RepID=A0A0C3CEP3_HEBCY|nr:hypothetical protein M413DRAFT_7791 [Hebeloma cylindrosporum h7]